MTDVWLRQDALIGHVPMVAPMPNVRNGSLADIPGLGLPNVRKGWKANVGAIKGAMCHFITLVAPGEQEIEVAKVLEAHGRVARKIRNPNLARLTPQGSAQFLTTHTCDCGTILGRTQPTPLEVASAHDKEVRRLRKKGWSDSKIERSLSDKEAALATSTARKPTDTFELWSSVISDLVSHRKTSHVGLFLHSYRGGLEDEPLEPKVHRALADVPIAGTLRRLEEDELVYFS